MDSTPAMAGSAPDKVVTPSTNRSSIFPYIPPDKESRILMYTGAGLAAVGLVAFVLFNTGGSSSKAAADGTNTGGTTNPDASASKSMTIQWAP